MTTTPTIFATGRAHFGGTQISGPDITTTRDGGFVISITAVQGDEKSGFVNEFNAIDPSGTAYTRFGDVLSYDDPARYIQVIQADDGEIISSFIFGYSSEPGVAQFHPAGQDYVSIDLSAKSADCTAMFESCALSNGGFISLWEQTTGSGGDERTSVWFREVGADDQPIGAPATAISDPAENQTAGIMTILNDGSVIIGWDNAAPGAAVADLTIRHYDGQGQPLADPTIVATHDAGSATAVHELAGGGYVVAWDEASAHEATFQLFAADGTAQGTAISFAGDFSGQIASVYDGGFVIEASDGASFLQRYSAEGVTIGDHLAAAGELATLADGRIAVATSYGYTIVDPRNYEISGTTGDDVIYGRIDGSEISGLEGNDTLFGGAAADILRGGAGDDALHGGHAGDVLRGSDGNDALTGDNGNDDLDGGPGNDDLLGGSGNDALAAGGGTDVVSGGAGNDILDGGDGADTLTGGKGKDLFVFDRITDSGGGGTGQHDVISDFGNKGDRIDLHQIDGDSTHGGQQEFTFIGTAAFTGAGQVRYSVQGNTTLVQLNNDSDDRADMTIILDGQINLKAANFVMAGEHDAHLDLFHAGGVATIHGLDPANFALV